MDMWQQWAQLYSEVHTFSAVLFQYFFSWWGVFLLGALDSSVLFSLPFGIDAVVIILTAQSNDHFLFYAILANVGSLIGAAASFWIGSKAGEKGIEKFAPSKRLELVRKKVHHKGAVAIAALDLVPPPFPFTAFILMAGALKVSKRKFFVSLGLFRMIRFGGEAALAKIYGEKIISWLQLDIIRGIIGILIFVAIISSAFSAILLFKTKNKIRQQERAQ